MHQFCTHCTGGEGGYHYIHMPQASCGNIAHMNLQTLAMFTGGEIICIRSLNLMMLQDSAAPISTSADVRGY